MGHSTEIEAGSSKGNATIGKSVGLKSDKSWQTLGVSPSLSRALIKQGLRKPTPIQRACLPSALAEPRRDIVGTSRTGSGKTLAYLIPLIQRIQSRPTNATGPSGLVLCPNRELALQILRTGKRLSQQSHRSIGEEAGAPITWALAVGGEAIEAQFETLSNHPDIIVATPGRFLHLIVEMAYDLRNVKVVVYDEADRLFEMGFQVQLDEILHRLPNGRQNLLFSATIPSVVAEFARAGLTNPTYHRIDKEYELSPDLRLTFISTTPEEKPASLLIALETAIGIRPSSSEDVSTQAIVFVATKHHVEYINSLLTYYGYRVAYIYGSLNQIARKQQLSSFSSKLVDILVVTDVAARGLDIPIMEHVINYDLPSNASQFVHRVGRTARAGRTGSAWSMVTRKDMAYYLDIRRVIGDSTAALPTLDCIPQPMLDDKLELLHGLVANTQELDSLYSVLLKSQRLFERTRNKPSKTSIEAAKALCETLQSRNTGRSHTLFQSVERSDADSDRAALLDALNTYRPACPSIAMPSRGLSKTRSPRAHQAPHESQSRVQAFQNDNNAPHFTPLSQHTTSQQSLTADENQRQSSGRASQLKWDRKQRQSSRSHSTSQVKSENGSLIPASFNSGRYASWRAKKSRIGRSRGK